jgi:hypothetical protein
MQDRRVTGDPFAASKLIKWGRSKAFFTSEVPLIVTAIMIGTVKQEPLNYAERRRPFL